MPAFTTTAQLLRYAEDEYFSEFMLRAMKPAPSAKPPRTVTFEWGLVVGSGKMQMYTFTATGVTTWSLDGEWEKHAVVEFALPKARKGIVLVQKVPGVLRLECAKLSVVKGAVKRYTLPPEIDPEGFLVWGPQPVSWNQLREWLGVPASHNHYDQTGNKLTLLDAKTFDKPPVPPYFTPTRIQPKTTKIDDEPWMYVMWMLGVGNTGHYFSVHRGTCDDATWARAVRLPQHLGPCNVLCRTVKCDGATWLKKWAPKAATARTTGRST